MLATRVINYMNNKLMVFTIRRWIDGVLYTKTKRDVLELAMIRLRNRYIKYCKISIILHHRLVGFLYTSHFFE